MVDITRGELEQLNPKKQLVERSVKEFGKTFNCREAGYVLENGDMLDFSGKREGGTAKTRSLDHREVCKAIETGGKGISGGECLDFFERQANALRFGTYGTWQRGHDIIVQPNTFQSPTKEQANRIKRCCDLYKVKSMYYDVYDDRGDRLDSGDVKGSCSQMVVDIMKALEEAKKKEKSYR